MVYTARLKDCVAALHAFQKKTQTTSPRDIELARTRWVALSQERQMKPAKSTTSKKPAPPVESFASVWDALADTPEQAAFDLWQARAAAKASKALSGVKALKLQPA